MAQNDRFVIYLPKRGDTLKALGRRFLADDTRAPEIAELNGITKAEPGQPLVIALRPHNPIGVYADGYQTVPILSYHRFGEKDGRMVVTPEAFAAQLDYLAKNDFQVVRLADLAEFLAGKRPLPRRAVVITMDDGYASMYEHAFPLLEKHGFPATVFVYTDFVGAKDALSWEQMAEMRASGLVDIQSHSKSHANLSYRLPGESERAYRERLAMEVRAPAKTLQQRLSAAPVSFAYPFGDTNQQVIDTLIKADYKLAVTVDPGGNPFFAYPLMLKRSMVFGDQDLGAFIAKLQVYRPLDAQ
jgi:peptidoglycan/xylan/chitin deacetylase (PgdA/CDA1 family)